MNINKPPYDFVAEIRKDFATAKTNNPILCTNQDARVIELINSNILNEVTKFNEKYHENMEDMIQKIYDLDDAAFATAKLASLLQ